MSGNSWLRDNSARRILGSAGLSRGAAAVTACALSILAASCDAPAPSMGKPDPPPAAAPKTTPPGTPAAPDKPTATAALPPQAPVVASTSAPESPSPRPARKADSQITASATVNPSKVRAGETVTLRVDVQIEPGWHIYAIDRPTGPSIPTSIHFDLPKSLAWDGDWSGSEPTLDDANPQEPSFVYTSSASFSRRVRVAKSAESGIATLGGNVRYQACDRFSCRAPTQLPLKAQVTIRR